MKKKYIIALFAVLVIALLFIFTPIRSYLTPSSIETFVGQFGVFAPLVYGIIYFILVLLFISAAAFSILAGTLFGPIVGTTVVVIAATLAAMVAFIIGRHLGKDAVDKLAKGKGIGKWVSKLDEQVKAHGFQTFFIMRCLFVPYIPVSYAAGLVKHAKLWDFVLATFVTNIIFSFVFVYLGDKLLDGPKALILPVVLVVLALLVPRVVRKIGKSV